MTSFTLNIITYLLVYQISGIETKLLIGLQNYNTTNKYEKVDSIISYYNNKFFKQLPTTDVHLEESILPTQLNEVVTPSIRAATFNQTILLDKSSAGVLLSANALANVATETALDTDFNIGSNLNNSELESLLLKFDSDDGNSCLLDCIKTALLWWTFPNGTLRVSNFVSKTISNHLDLSYRNIASDEVLYAKAWSKLNSKQIIAFSAAYNNLTTVPRKTLELLGTSLKYLTLSGNQFVAYVPNTQKEGTGIAWATFPLITSLLELDISNCRIEYITKDAFENLPNLRRLVLSQNKMSTIPFDTFYYIQSLQYLDLSFTNVFYYTYQVTLPTNLEAIFNLFYGLKIQQATFKYLPNLMYLDLSHTKLTRNSALAFTHLGANLKYLSLCYTAFPMIGKAIFKNMGLIGLDLSGNTYAAYTILDDAFKGISDSLNYLYFERSNLKELGWLKYLKNLRWLGLAGNNINSVTLEKFSTLQNLQVLDLSSNHVGNWYNRVFMKNENLSVLNLRDNNINIITSEMLKDFSLLDYLSLGDNNFVCDCMLRELVDLSAANNKNVNCSENVFENVKERVKENIKIPYKILKSISKLELNKRREFVDMPTILWSRHLKKMKLRTANLKKLNSSRNRVKMRFVFDAYNIIKSDRKQNCDATDAETSSLLDKLNGSILKLQLLDYEEEHYWCFNETERLNFFELSCQQRSIVEDIIEQLNTLTKYVLTCVGTIFGVTIVGLIIYWKRWYIQYYYSSIKSAALLSVAKKDSVKQFDSLAERDHNLIYDIFISYCQNDSEWVLKELMPNIEETGDISICLHERDFQIGVTILDNIVSCMERSRALMLIISSNFLLSHWCQFEMHLAQHRIFDVSKVHLILVFLEDIPRSKRPKNLQYLMDIKTYIKWPGEKGKKGHRLEERKIFWKRLRNCLNNIGLNPAESRA